MNQPITVDIPHKLGKAGARARMEQGADKLVSFVPGSTVTEHRWEGDTLSFVLEAMGQRVGTRMEVHDSHVHAVFDLPPMLALLAGKLRDKLVKDGTKLLS